MVKKETKAFQMRINDVNSLLNELSKWNIEPEKTDERLTFSIQSNNVCYTIEVYVIEKLDLEEQLFILNLYPHVKTFADIQMKIFNKVIWNWK